jgi:hypothetical protein
MFANLQIPNPRYVGAPARMSDARLFTSYKPNCRLLPALQPVEWADLTRRSSMVQGGERQIKIDRALTSMAAGSTNCVDTMVPELTKRSYVWNSVKELGVTPVGIGEGRLYLPGRPDLVRGDPDLLALATFPELPGTFSMSGSAGPAGPKATATLPLKVNRYSAPYG